MKKTPFAIPLLICFLCVLSAPKVWAEIEVFFSPEGEIRSAVLAEIDSSRETIDVAVHEISSLVITQSLTRAKQRGVKVRVVTDGKQARLKSSQITYLVTQGVSVKVLKGKEKGMMNHRFAIFDRKKVVTGSFSWSEQSEKLNHENMVVLHDKDAVVSFQDEFDRLWREKRIIR